MAVISISRMPGSQGDEIAYAVAERLSYRLVGRQELASLATTVGGGGQGAWDQSPELRERSPSFWERLNEERRRHASVLRHAVLRLAEEDNVVIVGLGAGQFLRGLRGVLRVQIVAPQNVRLERLMEAGSSERPGPLDEATARDLLRRLDRDAAGYIRYLFNVDWLDPLQWDVVLNSSRFAIGESAELVASFVEKGMSSMREDDQEQLRDMALASKVEAALLNDANVWVSGLRVKVEKGRVKLEGEVIAEEDRDAAEGVVRQIPDVKHVDNDLRLQPPPLAGI